MDAQFSQKNFRLKLFVYTASIVLLGAALAGASMFMLFAPDLGEGYGSAVSTLQKMEGVLMGRAAGIYAAVSILIIGGVVMLNLFYSHRIAGPAYRLSREAEAIGRGSLKGNIRFRRKDNLADMGESLSQVAFRYKIRIDTLKEYIQFMEVQLDTVSDLIEKGRRTPALERTANEMTGVLKRMNQVIADIRT